MRSKRAAVAAVVTLGALMLSPGIAWAGGKDRHKGDTLRLVATTLQEEFLDLGTPGPSLGDEFVFSEVLRSRGREVGTSGGVCVATEVVPPYTTITFHCVATLSLRKGQITLQGLVEVQGEDDPGPFVVAITGGTGAFFGAGGEAVIRDISPRRTVYKLKFDDKGKKNKKKKKPGRGRH